MSARYSGRSDPPADDILFSEPPYPCPLGLTEDREFCGGCQQRGYWVPVDAKGECPRCTAADELRYG